MYDNKAATGRDILSDRLQNGRDRESERERETETEGETEIDRRMLLNRRWLTYLRRRETERDEKTMC